MQLVWFEAGASSTHAVGNAVEDVVEGGSGAAQVDAETASIVVAAEGSAVVQRHMCPAEQTVFQFFMAIAQGAEVEPGQVGGFGQDRLDLRQMSVQVAAQEFNVAVQVAEQLRQPFLAVAKGGLGADIGEDVAACHLVGVQIAKEAFAQLFAAAIAYGATQTSHIEGLAGSHEGDGNLLGMRAHGAETDVAVRWERHVGVDFVGNDVDVVAVANLSHTLKGFLAPDGAAGVVGVAEDKPAALACTPFEVFEVDGKAPVHDFEGAAHQLPSAALGQVEERRVNRCGDQYAVARLGHGLKHEGDARHDARDEMEFLFGALDKIVAGEPLPHGLPIAFGRNGVAQHLMGTAVAQGLHDEVGGAEVHIGHPHGGEVVATKEHLQRVVFYTIGMTARDYLVEVVGFQG